MNTNKRKQILYTGKIFTGLSQHPWVEAVGIQDNHIACIGNLDQVKSALSGAEIMDLPAEPRAPAL